MKELEYKALTKLTEKAKQNDKNAFAELYKRTYQKQFRFVFYYVKDYYLTQDILQEVYLLAYKHLNRLKDARLFQSWLNQITFRVCFHKYKKYKKQQEELEYSASEELLTSKNMIITDDPEKQVIRRREREELMKKILKLPPKESQVIIMRYYCTLKLKEIAKAMGISQSTVKRYLARGQAKLKKHFI